SVNNQSWFNRAIVYTHGFGVVAANGNQRNPDGEPTFMESDIPPSGEFPDYEPRVYFGESSPDYSIVGAEKGATPRELDYPSDEDSGSGQANNTFSGDGGPSVGNVFNRLAYALKFRISSSCSPMRSTMSPTSSTSVTRVNVWRSSRRSSRSTVIRIRPSLMGRSSGSSTATPLPRTTRIRHRSRCSRPPRTRPRRPLRTMWRPCPMTRSTTSGTP